MSWVKDKFEKIKSDNLQKRVERERERKQIYQQQQEILTRSNHLKELLPKLKRIK